MKLSIMESIAKLNNKIKGHMNYVVNDEILPKESANIELYIFLKSSYHLLSWSFSIHTNMNEYYPHVVSY